jgi:predicted DNA-binding transcriptional regulator YafY
MPVDMANDGDNYEDISYQEIFRTLLSAIQTRKVLLITYESGKGNRLSAYFAPYKLEYALKDDKFRLVAVRIRDNKLRSLYKLNLSHITSAEILTWNAPADLKSFIHSQRMKTPVEIEITNERNGFERIFTQLSNFERISEYDEETKTCHMKIFYYEVDEMELFITLLSFGPVIRVVGPEHFRDMYIERIKKQQELLTFPLFTFA